MAQTRINILGWAGVLLFMGLMLYNRQKLPAGWMSIAQTILGVLPLLVWVFERYLWRWPLINLLADSRPDIQGTWKGVLTSEWEDPQTKEKKPPIEVYFVVRQTFATLHLRLFTPESQSGTLVALLESENGKRTVNAIYRNEPELPFRNGSPIHHGSFFLEIIGTPPRALRGHYWTDRNTKGVLDFTARSKTLFDDFQSASASDAWTQSTPPPPES